MGLLPLLALAGAGLLTAAFFFRNQKTLRMLAAAGSVLLFIFFALSGGSSQWPGMAATALIMLANIMVLAKSEAKKRPFKLTAEEMMLFARLPGLSPGSFKSLLSEARWQEPKEALLLTTEGVKPEALHYVVEGTVSVNKSGKAFPLGPHAFVGELAFLRDAPATATVHAAPGALVVSWPTERLRALFNTDTEMREVMSTILSEDMAEKIARSDAPLLARKSTRH